MTHHIAIGIVNINKALPFTGPVAFDFTEFSHATMFLAALIGAVLGLGTLASNSELIVMRAAGISLWRFQF